MAYFGYTPRSLNSGGSNDREMAINWDSRNVTLSAYESALVAFDKWNLARLDFDDEPKSRAEFLSAMTILYLPLSSEFDKYIIGVRDDKNKDKWQFGLQKDYKDETIIKIATPENYMMLVSENSQKLKVEVMLILFKVLVNWCVQYGPFRTFTDKKAMDIFDEVEEESI